MKVNEIHQNHIIISELSDLNLQMLLESFCSLSGFDISKLPSLYLYVLITQGVGGEWQGVGGGWRGVGLQHFSNNVGKLSFSPLNKKNN